MNQAGMIASVIAIAACLVLALRNPEMRTMGAGKAVRLAAIWAAIIIGLVLVIQFSGFRIEP
ncbi:hypothetical protein [Sphingobium sp.]|uniref:hypothetical protein n=1 Tax=Sphingobium sp. TaxID=1912891 RepID=UPI002C1FD0E3|nr:hypothetical protein [Sphingobium sp.]HUD90335.1 hypothetical protein [Sphingobium sp.]